MMSELLMRQIDENPFQLVYSLIFLCAIIHTFLSPKLIALSHRIQHRHIEHLAKESRVEKNHKRVSLLAQLVHLLGELELVFGLWVVPLFALLAYERGWQGAVDYLSGVHYTEPLFVFAIMAAAATRPILNLSENMLRRVASLGGGGPGAWWIAILTLAPLLGSFITEPAAMTIAALLLGRQFFRLRPSRHFEYATLGLLFVNISVGGTLTNFAAPPILMVAGPWDWSSLHLLSTIGWKAVIAIVISNLAYYAFFRKEFANLADFKRNHELKEVELTSADQSDVVPLWIKGVHIAAMAWIVFNAHDPVLFLGGFALLVLFMRMTPLHQNHLVLRNPLLVACFLAGLVIHGGLQGWWISPVLGNLEDTALLFISTGLTAFNDNAAITYLSTLVENFSAEAKYAVVAGAVAGGGLTIIANAPNPAGAAILNKYFKNKAILPLHLAAGAALPTIIVVLCFLLL
jgi:hypothetical protein